MALLLPPDLAISLGRHPGITGVHHFGENPDVDTATDPEDVWDVGGIWVPPTQARVHNLVSTDAADAAGGTGVRTVHVHGMTSWDSAEVVETVVLNGLSNVATVNAYVIVYELEGLTFGSGKTNVGNVTATAVTDGTVSAQITAGFGKSRMAIMGLPSTQELALKQWYFDIDRSAGSTVSADLVLCVNSDPGGEGGWVVQHHLGASSGGSSYVEHSFGVPRVFPGPAIVVVQVLEVSANDTDVSAGFDGYLAWK